MTAPTLVTGRTPLRHRLALRLLGRGDVVAVVPRPDLGRVDVRTRLHGRVTEPAVMAAADILTDAARLLLQVQAAELAKQRAASGSPWDEHVAAALRVIAEGPR